MAKLRTNADAGLRARQLLSQLSSLTQVEVEISRLVTSTKRTALRVSAQLRTLQSGHGQEGVGGAVLGMLGGAMIVPYWLILHTTTPMNITSFPVVTRYRYHWRALTMSFTLNGTTKLSILNFKSSQVLIAIT